MIRDWLCAVAIILGLSFINGALEHNHFFNQGEVRNERTRK